MMGLLSMSLDELYRELDSPGTMPSRRAAIR